MNLREELKQLSELADEDLLRSLKRHVAGENRLNALVLAHLAEVDARGAYRQWACETLTAYCVYELRLSEDEAQRRCRAARVMRKFPVLFEMLAEASIHLTGVLLLAPHLTEENHLGLLQRARYRRKREIEQLVAELAPLRDAPALIEPLGLERVVPPRASGSWAATVAGTTGWVRELQPGDGPARAPAVPDEWHDALLADQQPGGGTAPDAAGPEPDDRQTELTNRATEPRNRATEPSDRATVNDAVVSRDTSSSDSGAETRSAPARIDGERAPLRYRVQFTANQAYVELLERARALLWHQVPNGDLARIQHLALEALVEKLLKRKCAVRTSGARVERSEADAQDPGDRCHSRPPSSEPLEARCPETHPSSTTATAPAQNAEQNELHRTCVLADVSTPPSGAPAPSREPEQPPPADACAAPERSGMEPRSRSAEVFAAPERSRQVPRPPSADVSAALARHTKASRSRHIPAAVRREVWERDDGRCTFVDARGQRCRAVAALEFHHEQPHARGGPATVDNIYLRCCAHNRLAAEQDFGRGFMGGWAARLTVMRLSADRHQPDRCSSCGTGNEQVRASRFGACGE